ncbi:MAG: PAS domain-containing protein [Sphingosinicella sp.]|nr:PAS domain-containing protein [Sphingosinicella sp.]
MLSEHEKDLLLDNLPGMAYRCSVLPPWPLEYVSAGVRYLCSYAPADLVSGSIAWGDLLHPHDAPQIASDVAKGVADHEQFSLTYRIIDPEMGERWVLERGEAVYGADGEAEALIGFIMDITEQKAVEEKLRRLQAELIHLSGATAMGTMATTLAHELNQPLAAAANYLAGTRRIFENLSGQGKQNAEQGLDDAHRQVQRAGEIIQRMRNTVSKRPGVREEASLTSMVGRAAKVLEASNSCPGFSIRTRISSGADRLWADTIQIEQALLNLVRNAAEAARDADKREVMISSQLEVEGLARIRVRDWGRGLPDEDPEKLFDAFGTSSTGGLGVGLSITRTIVEAHGGKIWADNNPDGGASFYFTVPVARG